MREGRMTEAGRAKIDLKLLSKEDSTKRSPNVSEPTVPRFVRDALVASPGAWEFFKTLAPSYRSLYVRWISSAKKEETRNSRLREAIGLLEQGKNSD